jgi:hypothetical protein
MQGLPPKASSTQEVILVVLSQKKTVKWGLNENLFWLILGKWCKVHPAT